MRTRDKGLLNTMRDRTVVSMVESRVQSPIEESMHLLLRDERLEAASRLIFQSSASTAAACRNPLVTIARNEKGMVDQ